MATVKIDTAVDAAAFSEFFNLFQKFGAGVHAQGAAWTKVASAGGEARGTIEDAARSVRALADTMDDVLARTKGLDVQTEKVSRRWTSLARGTKDAAGHIKDATGSLLKWAGITGLVAGVAGFGAEHLIFGLGRSVSANRSTAMGLGTTYGGLAAARIGYQRFGDAEGLLGRIADAQNDPSKQLAFGAVGMGREDFEGRDSADVMAEFMKRAKDTLDKIPDDQLGNRLRTTHLGEMLPLEEARRLIGDRSAQSKEEAYGQADSIARNRRELDLDPKVQRQWQEFTTKLSLAGSTIETVFVNRLVALEPGLLKLSEAATKIATALLAKDGPVSQWIGELDTGLEWLAENIDKKEFQDQVSGFVKQLVDLGAAAWGLAKSAGGLLHWLAKLTGSEEAAKPPDDPMVLGGGGTPGVGGGGANPSRSGAGAGGRRGFMTRGDPVATGAARLDDAKVTTDPNAPGMAAQEKHIIEYAKSIGVDPRVALTVAHSEGLNALGLSKWGAGVDHGRSHGNFQLFSGGGLGDKYKKETGRDPYDQRNSADMDEWALRYAKHHGWNDWHGATKHGIRGFYGINREAPDSEPAPAAAAPKMTGLRAAAHVTVNKNTGGNPSQTAAMAAAPQ